MYKTVGGGARCPALDIVLTTIQGNELTSVTALVDSGADCSMFPIEWASKLGIELKDCREEECATAGGPVAHYVYEPGISAMIEGREHKLAATFCEHLSVVLLGRDLFLYHKITFDERAKCITLEPYPSRDAHSMGEPNPRTR
jgi:predicted aspartyl protease